MRQPPNHKAGLLKSRDVRKEKSRTRRRELWERLVSIAIIHQPRTNREYVAHLTGWDVPTAQGRAWSPGLVSHALKEHGLTPKKLWDRVTRPSPFAARRDWPAEVYRKLQEELDRLNETSVANGEWVSATRHPVQRANLVRHADFGIGQAVQQTAIAKYRCSFLDEEGSFDLDCSASELQVFRYHVTREERIRAGDRLQKNFRKRYRL